MRMLLFSAPEHHKQIGVENVAPKIGSSRNFVAACRYWPNMGILPIWEPSRATTFYGNTIRVCGGEGAAGQTKPGGGGEWGGGVKKQRRVCKGKKNRRK